MGVTVRHRDVCSEGFDLEGLGDAVFLDLPHPWEVISHAKLAMKRVGGRICSFSPCIEQVQKTCVELKKCGFTEVSTLECLNREFQDRKRKMETDKGTEEEGEKKEKEAKFLTGVPLTNMPGHTGYLTFATLPAQKASK